MLGCPYIRDLNLPNRNSIAEGNKQQGKHKEKREGEGEGGKVMKVTAILLAIFAVFLMDSVGGIVGVALRRRMRR